MGNLCLPATKVKSIEEFGKSYAFLNEELGTGASAHVVKAICLDKCEADRAVVAVKVVDLAKYSDSETVFLMKEVVRPSAIISSMIDVHVHVSTVHSP